MCLRPAKRHFETNKECEINLDLDGYVVTAKITYSYTPYQEFSNEPPQETEIDIQRIMVNFDPANSKQFVSAPLPVGLVDEIKDRLLAIEED